MKKAFIFFSLFFLILIGCKSEKLEKAQQKDVSLQEYEFRGKTMGTTYLVKYIGKEYNDLQFEVDSLLAVINNSVSTYIPESTISTINTSTEELHLVDQHFLANFLTAKEVYKQTNQNFNPAIMPLVNYWGFGFERISQENQIDTLMVNELKKLVDFDSFYLEEGRLIKKNPKAQLDFSAIAKGYGVDQIAILLTKKGINNYLVEIGGELYASGKNKEMLPWVVGIRKPIPEEKNTLIETCPLENRGMATSGNYENYIELENKKTIAHTINPKTGFPQSINEELLSTTVFAPTSMAADAYATAFKVMGLEESLKTLERLNNVDVFFVYRDTDGKIGLYSTLKQ